MPVCHQCGQDFEIDEAGVATHLTEGEIDHDQDADHIAYELPEEAL